MVRAADAGDARSRKQRWISLTAVALLITITGLTWVLAGKARSPRQLAANAAPPAKSTITVPVRFETLVRTVNLECRAESSHPIPVPLSTGDGQGDAVVTALPLKQGHRIGEGVVVVEVSGRPVIVLAGRLPAYRDISPGATGPDVRQLQAALQRLGSLRAGTISGVFDSPTRQAMARLYRSRGYSPPGGEAQTALTTGSDRNKPGSRRPSAGNRMTVPRRELLMVPRFPAKLGSVKAVIGGAARTGDLVVESGAVVLRCPVTDQGDAQGVAKGMKASVMEPNGASVRARVDRIGLPTVGSPTTASDGTLPTPGDLQDKSGGEVGNDEQSPEVTLRVAGTLRKGDGYRALIEVEKADQQGPVVPSSALWSRPGGRTVIRRIRAGAQTEVQVEPGFEVDGQVAITAPDGALREGDTVAVSAQASTASTS